MRLYVQNDYSGLGLTALDWKLLYCTTKCWFQHWRSKCAKRDTMATETGTSLKKGWRPVTGLLPWINLKTAFLLCKRDRHICFLRKTRTEKSHAVSWRHRFWKVISFCLKNSRHFHAITSKSKANRVSLAGVFPRFSSTTCYYFEFWLVQCIVCVLCDWLVWLLWFWFYDSFKNCSR